MENRIGTVIVLLLYFSLHLLAEILLTVGSCVYVYFKSNAPDVTVQEKGGQVMGYRKKLILLW